MKTWKAIVVSLLLALSLPALAVEVEALAHRPFRGEQAKLVDLKASLPKDVEELGADGPGSPNKRDPESHATPLIP